MKLAVEREKNKENTNESGLMVNLRDRGLALGLALGVRLAAPGPRPRRPGAGQRTVADLPGGVRMSK